MPDPRGLCRRSERLTRKSRSRTSNPEVQAHNAIMRSLGITSDTRLPDTTAFAEFIAVFNSSLDPSKQKALDLLFPLSASALASFAAVDVADGGASP